MSSDHFPMSVTCIIDHLPVLLNHSNDVAQKLDWARADSHKFQNYKVLSDMYLSHINIPTEVLNCKNPSCIDETHMQCIDDFTLNLTNALYQAGVESISLCNKGQYKQVPGWNEHVRDLHSASRDAFYMWKHAG